MMTLNNIGLIVPLYDSSSDWYLLCQIIVHFSKSAKGLSSYLDIIIIIPSTQQIIFISLLLIV